MMTKFSDNIAAAATLAAALFSIAPVLAGTVYISQHHIRQLAASGESTVYKALDEEIAYKVLDASIVSKSPIRD